MSVTAHLEELKKKHQSLSDQVDMAQRSPATDHIEVAAMKKQKLKLKEEITRLSN
ncbi:YdcH family protein [Tateyamaria sp. SN3-11]|uniref:YdcH family protein n=1 Tax=Tateyamaria sp. SN3-11 TaxID=3092147 RepID=UPI0039ED8124